MSANPHTAGWDEVGDRCFVRRYASFDLSVGVVLGGAGMLVIDSRASLAQGRELVEHLRELSPLPVTHLVNTHVHFDHTFGNAAFPGVPIVAHESVPADLPANESRIKRAYADDCTDPVRDEVLATDVAAPDTVFSSVWTTDLGDRYVELLHPGRGHTGGDIAITVPGADVVYAGDLVESSGPPSVGADSFPDEWPDTLELLTNLMTGSTVVVPGHGPPVDREFVLFQRLDLLPAR